jgi:hypothetical protein
MGCYESLQDTVTETEARELEKYNLDLVTVQDVTWFEVGSQPAEDHTHLSMEMGVLIIT